MWSVASAALAASVSVTIPAEGIALEGTLARPDGPGPFPAIVLVHGSGPNGRDQVLTGQLNTGFGFEVPVFKELSDALVGEGFAVLRYDKRTCTKANGCSNSYPAPPADISVNTFIDDAAAALAWLAQQEGIAPDKLIVAGHSQGATFVPALTHRAKGLVAGVVIAGNYRPIDALLEQQLEDSRALLQQLNMGDAALAPLQEAVSQVKNVRGGGMPAPTIMGAPSAFWEGWMAQADAMPALAKTSPVPLLIVGGTMDTNVPPSELPLWHKGLQGTKVPHKVVELPQLSHALTRIDANTLLEVTPASLGHHVDPTAVQAIVEFLAPLLQ